MLSRSMPERSVCQMGAVSASASFTPAASRTHKAMSYALAGYGLAKSWRAHVKSTRIVSQSHGDPWFLGRQPANGHAFIIHQPNAPSGGRLSHLEVGEFLRQRAGPEQQALLRLVERLWMSLPLATGRESRSGTVGRPTIHGRTGGPCPDSPRPSARGQYVMRRDPISKLRFGKNEGAMVVSNSHRNSLKTRGTRDLRKSLIRGLMVRTAGIEPAWPWAEGF